MPPLNISTHNIKIHHIYQMLKYSKGNHFEQSSNDKAPFGRWECKTKEPKRHRNQASLGLGGYYVSPKRTQETFPFLKETVQT